MRTPGDQIRTKLSRFVACLIRERERESLVESWKYGVYKNPSGILQGKVGVHKENKRFIGFFEIY